MKKKLKNICNSKVYEHLFNLYAQELRNFLIYKFQDIETAEDVVQDCFIKLWKNCSKVEYNKVKSYLFTIGNNLFINIKKHENVVNKFKKNNINNDRDVYSPEYIIIEEEYALKLEKLIDNLPEKQKIVFIMSRINKKKYKEIAEELQISIKTVEKRMSTTLKFLRDNLEYFK